MKSPALPGPIATLIRLLSPALAVVTLLTAAPARADLRTYHATWSGAPYGNSAQAIARIVIDGGLLLNPGDNGHSFGTVGAAIVSFDITVFGASVGNGTWTTSDFSQYALRSSDALNLYANWVGQPQPSGGTAWGFSGGAHDFNVFSTALGAPNGTGVYVLTTDNGYGNLMHLTSFAPVSATGARVNIGDTNVNLDLSYVVQEPPGLATGQTVKVIGLPPGLQFTTTPKPRIIGSVLGPVHSSGVQIQILQGSKLLRTIPYNLAVEPYKFAGGFEVLLEDRDLDFVNDDGIKFAVPAAAATPYPSTITVRDVTGTIQSVQVKLNGLNHAWPDDLDIFLMAPNGHVAAVLSDAGGEADLANVNLVFHDDGSNVIPDGTAITSGTYRPFNHNPIESLPPGGVGVIGNNLTALAAGGVNGEWKLFVSDDLPSVDGGSLASWELEFDVGFAPVGKIKVTVSSPTTRSPSPAYSATLERLGEPKRTTRGTFPAVPPPQPLPITFPASRTLPAVNCVLVLSDGSDLVTGYQVSPPDRVNARGFRLVRPGRIPGGNPALTLALSPMMPGNRTTTPGGVGYATGTVNAQALVLLKGLLGDAQPFTRSLNLSHTNQAVVWLTPYRNKTSCLGGIITIGDLGVPGRGASMDSAVAGLKWRRAADATATSYPAGFAPQSLSALVLRWHPVTTAEALAQTLGLKSRVLYADYISAPKTVLPIDWSLRDNFTLASLLPTYPTGFIPFTGRAFGQNGTFNGTFKLPAPATNTTLRGVFFQSATFGSFIGHGLLKIPITGPGLVKGSFQTSGIYLWN
jgi:subtilisin-like proprotein convertase family protein